MKKILYPKFLIISLILLTAQAHCAEVRTWTDTEGNAYEAELVNAFGPMAYFRKMGTGYTPFLVSNLVEEDRALVEALKESRTSHAWKASKSRMTNLLKGRLYTLEDGKQVNYVFGDEPEPDFYILYFVGSDNEEGDAFTPKLVSAYNRLKSSGLTNFEVILFSTDRSADIQKQYMKDMEIPFPNVKWTSKKWLRELTSHRGKGDVNLVILDQEGHILHRTVKDQDNLKPVNLLLSLNNLLAWTNPDNPMVLKSKFIAFLGSYLKQNPSDSAPRAYRCDLKGVDLSALPDGLLKVKLRVLENGSVDDLEILTEVSEPLEKAIRKCVEHWMFIPQIVDGAYHASTISFPIYNKAG